METTIAIYPIVKYLVSILLLGGMVLLFYKGYIKSAAAVLFIVWSFYILIPVKINGTNSVTHNRAVEKMQDKAMQERTEEKVVVHTPTSTFEERLAQEAKRSIELNNNIQEEIK